MFQQSFASAAIWIDRTESSCHAFLVRAVGSVIQFLQKVSLALEITVDSGHGSIIQSIREHVDDNAVVLGLVVYVVVSVDVFIVVDDVVVTN